MIVQGQWGNIVDEQIVMIHMKNVYSFFICVMFATNPSCVTTLHHLVADTLEVRFYKHTNLTQHQEDTFENVGEEDSEEEDEQEDSEVQTEIFTDMMTDEVTTNGLFRFYLFIARIPLYHTTLQIYKAYIDSVS